MTGSMHHFASIALGIVLVAFAGCAKKEKQAAKEEKTADPVAATPDVPASTPTLSIEVLKAATDLTVTGAPWSEALRAVEGRLGNVTTVHGAEYRWAARNTDSCVYLSVEKRLADSDAIVGTVQGPIITKASDDVDAWNRCLDSVGAQVADDPNAPSPPSAGSLTTVTELFDGIARKPSAWVGAKVTIAGFYVSTSVAANGEVETSTLTIAEKKADLTTVIGCTWEHGAVPPTLARWDAVRVSGTAHASFGGGLKNCTIAPE